MERIFEKFNWPFFYVTAAIIVIGIVNLYSAVCFWGEEGPSMGLFWSQLVWMITGLVLMFFVSFIDYRVFHRLALYIYIAVNVLLLASLFFGKVVRGTSGWLQLGGFSMQPAEFAKIAFIMIAAKYYSDHPNPEGFSLKDLVKPALLMLIPFVLIILQGDMGSSLFLILIFCSLSMFAKIRWGTIVLLLIVGLIAGGAVYKFGLKEYQRNRIFQFVHPETDIRGSGYHLMQSKIAVGSGKIFGKGYLKGNINKLRYLPERHTDFIFPVFAEEWGFLGSLVLLSLFGALLLMGVEIASKARERFGIFLAVGIVSMLFWQVVINLGGVLGLMPLTGVTLPLMSYGGSSVIVVLLALGMLQNISSRRFMF
jgi:rod shape determining protein RodA